ncbi:MAG: hypothetical protein WHS64_04405 [Fervidobacterium sp.]|uniref:Uncharacterized protein n=1 Tax=Fervidobacterium gondwanense DSM 13020 TaxID=1121883 RepID=A0A1M7SRX8_FERGO|nr:hypothetical protein [Fervidobacterium gondwanense]SHN61168.1 hypothetical protein SAMN02745226_01182 [Fervidobacterium gondwanense DSM 13020]
MNIVELSVVILILGMLFTFFVTTFLNAADIDLSNQYVETAVYSGLWKGELQKTYKSNECLVISTSMFSFMRPTEPTLSNLIVMSFKWVRSDTYNSIAVEPIFLSISSNSSGVK